MQITGIWYAQGNSAHQRAELQIDNDVYLLTREGSEPLQGRRQDLDISDRLGNVDRKITFPDGSVFATPENQAVDDLLGSDRGIKALIHRLESNLGWVAVALVFTIVTTFAFFRWGVPWIGHSVAHALPQKAGEGVGANALEL